MDIDAYVWLQELQEQNLPTAANDIAHAQNLTFIYTWSTHTNRGPKSCNYALVSEQAKVVK